MVVRVFPIRYSCELHKQEHGIQSYEQELANRHTIIYYTNKKQE